MFCLFNLAYINPSILSHECASKFKFCTNSFSNEMITDHKDVVSNWRCCLSFRQENCSFIRVLKMSSKYIFKFSISGYGFTLKL